MAVLSLTVLCALACFEPVRAAEVLPPTPERYFNDYAYVISPAVAAGLNTDLENLEKSNSDQVLVAIYPKMESDSSMEDYCSRIFATWHVGQKGKNNGAALFIFVQDHKMRIETGSGLEDALPDAACADILTNVIAPRFKAGDFSGGAAAGVAAMIQAASGPQAGYPKPKYTGEQQMQYVVAAKDAFLAQRQRNSQPFLDAHNAFEAAGGVNPAGLTTKETVTARRDLIAKCLAGNDNYVAFIKNQEATYRADLAATPLIPEDVYALAKEFAAHGKTDAIVQVRQKEAEILKCGDEMMATLEKTYGLWSVNEAGRLSFKEKSETADYTTLSEKYNQLVAESNELLKLANSAPSTSFAPSASLAAASQPGPPIDPAARAELVAGFKAAVQEVVAKGAASGAYAQYDSLNAVKALPSGLADDVSALENRAVVFRAKLDAANQLGDDCRVDIKSADGLAALRDAVQAIAAAGTPAASEKLSVFHDRGFSPETDAQKRLGKSLNSLWTICNHLKEQAKGLCERAKAEADAGKSAEAIKDYQDAYKIYPDPNVAQTIKRLREDSLGL